MLKGIKASTLSMPSFGHNLSLQKMEPYGDVEWNWSSNHASHASHTYQPIFDPSLYASFATPAHTENTHTRPQSVTNPHSGLSPTAPLPRTETAPPVSQPTPRTNVPGGMIKAQPAFKPTWNGFLDTTKDAMTIVEAALQGRLSHISRRPHDKERAEMLSSGTVLVYEENASGIKRWTDAVHWSPSRVMNNCLIYRQLTRALKPEEKKASLNPTCGGKRKRKESAGPSITKAGDNVENAEEEYCENGVGGVLSAGDLTPTGESAAPVYANFAQGLTPEQQRRFCGSLVDSYEFKEGGLMKKTISVKYQGTHHHIISYYSLEDVVNGKLKRPFEDTKLADIQPRQELLSGWKVSLEDEESRDSPLMAGYSQLLQPSHIQHHALVTHALPPPAMQSHPSLHLQIPDYWQGTHVPQYPSPQHSVHHYAPSAQQPSPQYAQHHAPPQYSAHPPPPQQYSPHESSPTRYVPEQQPTPAQRYPTSSHSSQYSPEPHTAAAQVYPQQPTPQYTPTEPHSQTQFAVPQAPTFELSVPVPQPHSAVPQQTPHPTSSPVQQHDPQRRASVPVHMPSYGQPQQPAPQPPYQAPHNPHHHPYYRSEQPYLPF